MSYIVLEICSGGRFLEDCFYYYSRQIISAVANESLFPYNLINRAFNTVTLNVNPNQKKVKYRSVFRTKDFFHTNINNKYTCKIVYKMQCFKNGF